MVIYNLNPSPGLTRGALADRCNAAILKTQADSGKTKKEFANSLGYSPLSMTRFLEREQEPTLKLLLALATVYGVDVCWLITGQSAEDALVAGQVSSISLQSFRRAFEDLVSH